MNVIQINPEHLKMTSVDAIDRKIKAKCKEEKEYWHNVAREIRLKKRTV